MHAPSSRIGSELAFDRGEGYDHEREPRGVMCRESVATAESRPTRVRAAAKRSVALGHGYADDEY